MVENVSVVIGVLQRHVRPSSIQPLHDAHTQIVPVDGIGQLRMDRTFTLEWLDGAGAGRLLGGLWLLQVGGDDVAREVLHGGVQSEGKVRVVCCDVLGDIDQGPVRRNGCG